MSSGIDHLAAYLPSSYLSLEDLAFRRGVDPLKYLEGIGIREMAIPGPKDDVVSMAANAGKRVLTEAGVEPGDVGLLIVGTESAEDKSKPVATHVHELLGVGQRCRVYDIMHACIGATYGVLTALDWLAAGSGRYALVIATDVARYAPDSPGEPTQGAGAVGILLTKSPRLLALREIANYSKNVYDFWKPMGSEYPIVKGVYSSQCYLEALKSCARDTTLESGAALVYHAPYPKLVRKAHELLMGMLGWDDVTKAAAGISLQRALEVPERVGNIYTGSVWLSLGSLLEGLLVDPRQEGSGGKRNYIFSYGSGCAAALLEGTLQSGWRAMAGKFALRQALDQRVEVSTDCYEAALRGDWALFPGVSRSGKCSYLGTRENERAYGWEPA